MPFTRSWLIQRKYITRLSESAYWSSIYSSVKKFKLPANLSNCDFKLQMHPFGVKMCTKDCYKVFGYFLGFMWIVTSFYYTMETIELLKLMKLQCTKEGAADAPPTTAVSIQARIQFDTELVGKVCDFYGRLGKLGTVLSRGFLTRFFLQMVSCPTTS